jgi:hypothetical protein
MHVDAIVDSITSLLKKGRANTPTVATVVAETATETALPDMRWLFLILLMSMMMKILIP